jgi:hypothetical protein
MASAVASSKAHYADKLKRRRVIVRIRPVFIFILFFVFVQTATIKLVTDVGECEAFSSPFDTYARYHRSSSSSSALNDATRSSQATQKTWTSMLTVDPTMILSILVNRGGLLIPDSVQEDLGALQQVICVEKAKLNVVEKKVILYNLTIALKPGQGKEEDAIRVGRVFVHWDSYTKPCIDVEVEDVHVLVEFTNLMLTRNDWNELRPILIPPSFEPVVANRFRPRKIAARAVRLLFSTNQESTSNAFVRFSSIAVAGKATVRLASRPLDKEIGAFRLDMGLTTTVTDSDSANNSVNAKIRELADTNMVGTGQRGCTAAELADLLQSHFSQQIRAFLKSHLQDLKSDPRSAIAKADRILVKTKGVGGSILEYANDAGRKKRGDMKDSIKNKLGRWEQSLQYRNVTLLKDGLKRIPQDLSSRRFETPRRSRRRRIDHPSLLSTLLYQILYVIPVRVRSYCNSERDQRTLTRSA